MRRPLGALVAEGFLSRLSFGVISFVLPLYAYQLGLGLAQIGVLLGFNLIIAMVLKVPMGWLADRVGCRPVLIAAIALRSAVCLLLVFAAAPWQLFAVRGLHGVSIALRDPATASLIATYGGKKKVAQSFAWYQTSKSVAGSFGKGAGGVLLGVSGSSFAFAFVVAFALSALPLWVVVRHVREGRAVPAAPATPAASPVGAEQVAAAQTVEIGVAHAEAEQAGAVQLPPAPEPPVAKPPTVATALLGLLVTSTAYMMANLFPVLAVEHAGLSEEQTGLIFMLAAVVSLTGPAFGWVSDRVSHRLVLSLRSVANVTSSVLYLVAPSFAGYAGAKLTDDLGKAAFKPAWGALMARVALLDPRRRARTMSAVSLGEDAGEVAGPIIAGLLWSTWGVGALFAVRIGLAVVTEVYAFGLERRLGMGIPSPVPVRPQPGPGRLVLDGARTSRDGPVLDHVVEPRGLLTIPWDGADTAAVLTGRRPPSAGRVTLDGHDLTRYRMEGIGCVVGVVAVADLPADGSVAAVLHAAGTPEAVARAWSLSGAASGLGPLHDLGARRVSALRPAERWLVATALAMVPDPSLIVAPTDPRTGEIPDTVAAALTRYPGAAVALTGS